MRAPDGKANAIMLQGKDTKDCKNFSQENT